MRAVLKKDRSIQEKKVVPNNLPRYVVCPVCTTKVAYTKRGAHRCLRIDFQEMDSKIQRGLW